LIRAQTRTSVAGFELVAVVLVCCGRCGIIRAALTGGLSYIRWRQSGTKL
jgi:hypothetical protein